MPTWYLLSEMRFAANGWSSRSAGPLRRLLTGFRPESDPADGDRAVAAHEAHADTAGETPKPARVAIARANSVVSVASS